MTRRILLCLLVTISTFSAFSQEENIRHEASDTVDVPAAFPGGTEAMQEFIGRNVQYPEISRELGDQGKIYVTFVVEIDGRLSDIEILKGATEELNREALRVVSLMPDWTPGEKDEEIVRSRCVVPITFSLISSKEYRKEKRERRKKK